MIDYDDLGRAASDNDALGGELQSFAAICGQLGVDVHGLVQAAEQRAMRIVLITRGPHEAARLTRQFFNGEFSEEDLDEDERVLAKKYAAVYMDAVLIGLRLGKEMQDA